MVGLGDLRRAVRARVIVDAAGLGVDDVFVDLGSGDGSVVTAVVVDRWVCWYRYRGVGSTGSVGEGAGGLGARGRLRAGEVVSSLPLLVARVGE